MKFTKLVAAGFAALGLSAGAALAEWPEKPITYVVSFGAGGNADIVRKGLSGLHYEFSCSGMLDRRTESFFCTSIMVWAFFRSFSR